MRAAKTFDEYAENRDTLLTLPEKYHNLWYFRSFSELERRAACGAQRLRVGPSVTIAQWVTVFPDSVGYLARLAEHHFNATTVVTIMQRLGYTRRGRDPSQLTMTSAFWVSCTAFHLRASAASTCPRSNRHRRPIGTVTGRATPNGSGPTPAVRSVGTRGLEFVRNLCGVGWLR